MTRRDREVRSAEGAATARATGAGLVVYVGAILAAGAGLLLWTWTGSALPTALGFFGFWIVLSLASECFWLETPGRGGMISMSMAVNMASLFVLPPHLALTAAAVSVGLADLLLHRRGVLKASFNAAQTVLAMGAAIGLIRWIAGVDASSGTRFLLEHPGAVLVTPVAYSAVNMLLVSGAISLHGGMTLAKAWRDNFGYGYQALSSATLFVAGVSLVFALESSGYISGLLYVLMFFFIRDAYQRYMRDRGRCEA